MRWIRLPEGKESTGFLRGFCLLWSEPRISWFICRCTTIWTDFMIWTSVNTKVCFSLPFNSPKPKSNKYSNFPQKLISRRRDKNQHLPNHMDGNRRQEHRLLPNLPAHRHALTLPRFPKPEPSNWLLQDQRVPANFAFKILVFQRRQQTFVGAIDDEYLEERRDCRVL